MGYDFLALTDHRALSSPTHLDGDMLLLSGMEMDYTLPGEVLHLVGIGMDARMERRGLPAARSSASTSTAALAGAPSWRIRPGRSTR